MPKDRADFFNTVRWANRNDLDPNLPSESLDNACDLLEKRGRRHYACVRKIAWHTAVRLDDDGNAKSVERMPKIPE